MSTNGGSTDGFKVRSMDREDASTRRFDEAEGTADRERVARARRSSAGKAPGTGVAVQTVKATPRWLDHRLGAAKGARTFMNKIFPDHWSFMIGEIAMYAFIVVLATGIYLTFFFIPSGKEVLYTGPYLPLHGTRVSEAYMSTVNMSLNTRFGLLMRQMHHWGCDIFIGAIFVHLFRIFFTGAFRRPRELNWIVGLTMLLLALTNGFLGYSLPDDLVSGTGLRITFSFLEAIPVVGNYIGYMAFGGNFPGDSVIFRFFILHVLIIPVLILGLLGAHLGMLVHHKHTQFRGPGRREDNVVGAPMWPTFMAKTTGFLFMVVGFIALLGGLAQVNPIWLYGQYEPYKVSYAVQPDWYMGFLDGALRIMPSWETHLPGHTIPNAFFPAILFPGIVFNILFLWPFIEAKITGENDRGFNLLDRPRDRPKRTAFGAGAFAFFFMLFGASSTDVLANMFHMSLNTVLWLFRILTFVIPFVVAYVTYNLCYEMQEAPSDTGKRKRHNIVVRSADGRYATIPTDTRPGDRHAEPEPEVLPGSAGGAPVHAGG